MYLWCLLWTVVSVTQEGHVHMEVPSVHHIAGSERGKALFKVTSTVSLRAMIKPGSLCCQTTPPQDVKDSEKNCLTRKSNLCMHTAAKICFYQHIFSVEDCHYMIPAILAVSRKRWSLDKNCPPSHNRNALLRTASVSCVLCSSWKAETLSARHSRAWRCSALLEITKAIFAASDKGVSGRNRQDAWRLRPRPFLNKEIQNRYLSWVSRNKGGIESTQILHNVEPCLWREASGYSEPVLFW